MAAVLLLGLSMLGGAGVVHLRTRAKAARPALPGRVRVEVVNATRTRGLARRATVYLRERGFDVVEIGTSAEQHDSTVVINRSGNTAYAQLVAKALGGARVEARPDSSRYLDVTVLLGASLRLPAAAETLNP